jgi:uncharacterized membrane protein
MDVPFLILRLVHIVGGVFWVGAGLLMLFFIAPTVRILGAEGQAFMQGFMRHSNYGRAMAISSLLTTVSGVLLFVRMSGGVNSAWMQSTSAAVLSVGAVAGFLAFAVGMGVIGPAAVRLARVGEALAVAGGPPSPEQGSQIRRLQVRVDRAQQYEVVLMVIALGGMALARYV